ncbi:unnamed protein product [Calicophoron daubneyi]|uniref:SPRY domain-containing protein 7 n=1 Tax=Calicophoron daubneyi TaxID=300641 RepID=A0AAV2U0L2_CALDB
MTLFKCFSCCQRLPYIQEERDCLLAPVDPPSAVTLDFETAGPNAVLLKNGLRICGNGAARSTAAINQDKAYFEAKVQSTGRWAVGLCLSEASLDNVSTLGKDEFSCVIREDSGIWCKGNMLAELKEPVEEGDVIGITYDHVQMSIMVNGMSIPLLSKPSNQPIFGVAGPKGTLYPVFGVAENAVLDAGFSARHFHYFPPAGDFDEILYEKELLR